MNDYSDLVIVAEEAFYSRKRESTTVRVYNTFWEIKEILEEGKSRACVIFQKSLHEGEICHAEVLFVGNYNAMTFFKVC
ncbi:hypothetical protein DdX_18953 [Ditylenchus destructor]|uniref:Uncharacterized protein n=1 Tax=Ditylenchus destructor TaxID=166010 RepID=A0AAD4MJR8_9BILA|nr:hypothetical protein DdX_18953 [Ditylenchus destructor]